MKQLLIVLAAMSLVAIQTASAAIKTQVVKYQAGSVHAQGFLAYDDAATGKRPGVVVVPEWWGLDDYVKHRAQQLAQLGVMWLLPPTCMEKARRRTSLMSPANGPERCAMAIASSCASACRRRSISSKWIRTSMGPAWPPSAIALGARPPSSWRAAARM